MKFFVNLAFILIAFHFLGNILWFIINTSFKWLGNLYQVYTKLRINDHTHPGAADEDADHLVTKILESIEKRWLKTDQDLFIACFFLNPFIDPALHNANNLTSGVNGHYPVVVPTCVQS